MALNKATATTHLKAFDFATLFIEELGWDRPASRQPETTEVDGERFTLSPVANKRGVRIFHCPSIPEGKTRKKIERELTKSVFEHLIIFTDAERTQQIWQWVERISGKPAAVRDHIWRTQQSPELTLQKLEHITFPLENEESLTLSGTVNSLKDAFTREQITRRFFGEFQTQHAAFLSFIRGLEAATDRQWYASLMLNRLMFVYFIQRKGFLDNNQNYLREKLSQVRAEQGTGQFHNFYRVFLLTLFHGGLAMPASGRDAATHALLGTIPYLNGGLFEPHILEAEGSNIEIADEAFEAVFNFFDRYDWTLDTRPISRSDGKEINPDVLGHIFEKYINQKQMGAYYTKEDITDYITKNTVIPWLFQNALTHDKVAFEAGSAVWRMLSENPDAYIYKAVKHGADEPLPGNIAAGIADVAKRGDWNKAAPATHGLPTEIWREVVARRERYEAIKAKAAAGEIASIEDFITHNLDIRQFARDAIQYAESPDLVRAFWKGISAIKVLDPACGSGAFLFAALGILYDLYDACLERMEQFVDSAPDGGRQRQLYSDFRTVLDQIERHPNRPYFIYKSIILDNLYGVDIMDEAVEICKLRLFLKLASQLERADQIEPLPDIDFNIRAGNTLIGYTSFADVERATNAAGLDFDGRAAKIKADTEDYASALDNFRLQQTSLGGEITPAAKADLKGRLGVLKPKLDRYLAQDYGVGAGDDLAIAAKFETWKASHKPFHWLIEFFGILTGGGFDVVVGNPPYLETREIDYLPKGLATLDTRAVHALFIERAESLLSPTGSTSMILPMSLVSTSRMKAVQAIIENGRQTWYSNFAWRPAKLFDTVNRALTIYVANPSTKPEVHTTGYIKWTADARDQIIFNLQYIAAPIKRLSFWVPKFQHRIEPAMLAKVVGQPHTLERIWGGGANQVYYRNTGGLYWKVFTIERPRFFVNGVAGSSSRETRLPLRDGFDPRAIAAILSSTTFWWWYTIASNLRDLNPADIQAFRVNDAILHDPELIKAGEEYLDDLDRNSLMLTREQRQTGTTQTQSFKIQRSKPLIDNIDCLLAPHYGFSDEELDFIVNYDIKYRMGADEDDAE
jgi:Eco57I restriction-modification methylase